jgi:hypothetical protein
MRNLDDPDPFEGMRAPRAPSDLSPRVLTAARRALAARARKTIWDRWWESRPLRLAWGVACLVLVLGHLLISAFPNPTDSPARSVRARRGETEGLRGVLSMPSLGISARAEALVFGSAILSDEPEQSDEPVVSEPGSRKEVS